MIAIMLVLCNPWLRRMRAAIVGEKRFDGVHEENCEAIESADALLLRPEGRLFRRPDFPRMKELLKYPPIFDGRNQYSPSAMKSMGFEYVCIGRG